MKKLLVVLLALVMVFAFASTAMAADTQIPDYNDLEGVDAELQIAIYRLSALGVLEGSAGWGNAYRPAENLTRAEFAKIAIYLTGNEDKVDLYAAQKSAFADVQEGYWAKGYINACYDLGLMKGRTVSAPLLFDPNGMVTYQEVATVVLRALGYDDNLKGIWPSDYSRKAGEVGIIKWVDYVGPQPINRADMASIANEALDLYMVSYVENEIAQGLGYVLSQSVDLDGFAPFIFYTNEKTGSRNAWGYDMDSDGTPLLEYAFDAYTADAQFLDFASFSDVTKHKTFSEASGWGYEDFADGELLFRLLSFENWDDWDEESANDHDCLRDLPVATDYYIWDAGRGELVELGDQLATATIFYDDDEVAFVEITSSIVRANEVKWDNASKGIIKADDTKYNESDELGWPFVSFFNGVGHYGELFLDEDGNWYDYKDFSYFENAPYLVIDSVDDDYIYFLTGEWQDTEKQKISKLDDFVIWKFGEGFIEVADLERGDVLYKTQGLEGDVDLYLVFAPQTGDLTKAHSDGVTIDDTKYGFLVEDPRPFSFYSYDSGNTLYGYFKDTYKDLGSEFFDNDVNYAVAYAFDNFVYFSVDTVKYNYGVVLGYDYGIRNTDRNEIVGLKMLYPDGSEESVKLASALRSEERAPREGSLISFKIESGEVASWDYRKDGKPIGGNSNASAWDNTKSSRDYDGNPTYKVTVDDDDRTLYYEGTLYSLAKNAEVFLITLDWDRDGDLVFDDAEILEVDKLLKSNFYAYQIAAAYINGTSTIKTLYVVEMESEGSFGLGYITFTGSSDSNTYEATINGETFTITRDALDVADGTWTDLDLNNFLVAYRTNANGVINGIVPLIGQIDDDEFFWLANSGLPSWFTVNDVDSGMVTEFYLGEDEDNIFHLAAGQLGPFTNSELTFDPAGPGTIGDLNTDTGKYFVRENNYKYGLGFGGDYKFKTAEDFYDDVMEMIEDDDLDYVDYFGLAILYTGNFNVRYVMIDDLEAMFSPF